MVILFKPPNTLPRAKRQNMRLTSLGQRINALVTQLAPAQTAPLLVQYFLNVASFLTPLSNAAKRRAHLSYRSPHS